jgi:hypothetical protein
MESPLLQYKKDRAAEYPSVEDQLDMIWHELKDGGSISAAVPLEGGVAGWASILQSIKDKHPKPELTTPEE